jgi:hypothetical protein
MEGNIRIRNHAFGGQIRAFEMHQMAFAILAIRSNIVAFSKRIGVIRSPIRLNPSSSR